MHKTNEISISPEEQIKQNLCRFKTEIISPADVRITVLQFVKSKFLQAVIAQLEHQAENKNLELKDKEAFNSAEINFKLIPKLWHSAINFQFKNQFKERVEAARKKGINIINYKITEAGYHKVSADIIEIKIIAVGAYTRV